MLKEIDFLKVQSHSNKIPVVVITKDPAFANVIGQRLSLSEGDIMRINNMYNCPK